MVLLKTSYLTFIGCYNVRIEYSWVVMTTSVRAPSWHDNVRVCALTVFVLSSLNIFSDLRHHFLNDGYGIFPYLFRTISYPRSMFAYKLCIYVSSPYISTLDSVSSPSISTLDSIPYLFDKILTKFTTPCSWSWREILTPYHTRQASGYSGQNCETVSPWMVFFWLSRVMIIWVACWKLPIGASGKGGGGVFNKEHEFREWIELYCPEMADALSVLVVT